MPGSPRLCRCIQNWTGMRRQTWCPRLLDEEGSIGGEYRHISGATASFHSGGSTRLHIIELLRKHSSIGQEGKEARSAGDATESACGGSCPS